MRGLFSRLAGGVIWVAAVPKRSKEAMFNEYGRLVPCSIRWSWRLLLSNTACMLVRKSVRAEGARARNQRVCMKIGVSSTTAETLKTRRFSAVL
jgi:hypothetical protein